MRYVDIMSLVRIAAAAAAAGVTVFAAGSVAAGAGSAETAPTFAKDVAPILFENCAACHRPGNIAPMSLLS